MVTTIDMLTLHTLSTSLRPSHTFQELSCLKGRVRLEMSYIERGNAYEWGGEVEKMPQGLKGSCQEYMRVRRRMAIWISC